MLHFLMATKSIADVRSQQLWSAVWCLLVIKPTLPNIKRMYRVCVKRGWCRAGLVVMASISFKCVLDGDVIRSYNNSQMHSINISTHKLIWKQVWLPQITANYCLFPGISCLHVSIIYVWSNESFWFTNCYIVPETEEGWYNSLRRLNMICNICITSINLFSIRFVPYDTL